jgi:hypothetical protein
MTLSADALRSVAPQDVAAWLRANHSELVDTQPERTATWRKAADAQEEFLIDLPLDPRFLDYARRMGEIFDTLAVVSRRLPSRVLEEVRASTSDIIRFRSMGPSVREGRVPVDLGTRRFALSRDLLLAAACSARDPRAVYRTRKPAEAVEFLRRVQLVAPEAGSFVVAVHAPIPPGLPSARIGRDDDPPFERRATLMLATAVATTRHLAEMAQVFGSAEALLHGAASGVSANLCDALAAFVDGTEATGLDLEFAWATTRPVPADTPTSVHVGAEISPILREGARLLRVTDATPDFEIAGAVLRLESGDPAVGGTAVIVGQVDGRPRRVRVPMGPEDYARAIAAHETGQILRCEGELVRRGRNFELDHVRHVTEVLDDL